MEAYLGDGLYVRWDGSQFRIYATDGIRVTNEVFLEPDMLQELNKFAERVK